MSSLQALARAMAESDEGSLADISLASGFKQGGFPAYLQEEAGEETLMVTGEDLRLYNNALERLSRERELEHLSKRDIDDELWAFTCETFLRRAELKAASEREQGITDLLSRLQKPWQDYVVLSVVDHLRVPGSGVHVLGVDFRELTSELAESMGIRPGDRLSDRLHEMFPEAIGSTVAIAEEKAGSPQRAGERARNTIDDALNALRVTLAGGIPVAMVDERVLFRRGSPLIILEKGSNVVHSVQWHRSRRPIDFDLASDTKKLIGDYLGTISKIEDLAAERLRSHLGRAVHWIGTSMTSESDDDKVVHLCTALETLLAVKSDRWKGETISLRYMLLSAAVEGSFVDPIDLLALYELRSDVVHGSRVRVATRRESSHLLWLTTIVLRQTVNYAAENQFRSMEAMFRSVEDEESLRMAVAWLIARGVSPNSNMIKAALGFLKHREA